MFGLAPVQVYSQPKPGNDATMTARLSYELSCDRLRELRLLARDDQAPMPNRLPRYDDEEPLGVNVFRTRLAGDLDLSDLSLPRTYFGRSEINCVSFRNSDLHESICAGTISSELISLGRI
jgi:hypothetical protein